MKKFFATTFSLLAFLDAAYPASAVETICNPNAPTFGPLCNTSISVFIPAFINLLFIFAVIIALIYLVWGGFKWLMSGGDKTSVQGAREHIIAAIVGLVIIFLSYFVLNLVIGFFLPNFTLSKFTLPTISNPFPQ